MADLTPTPRRRRPTARAAAILLGVAALLFAGPVTAASATDPVTLGTGYVLDDADILTDGEEAAAQERLERLRDESGLDLWVVYVDAFTSPDSAIDWTDEVAIDNGLGPTQYLLGIAVDTRQMNLSGDLSGPLTDEQIGAIAQDRVIPALQDDDWFGAVDAAAAGLTAAQAGGTGGGDAPGTAPAASGTGALVTVIAVVAVVAVIAVIVIVLVARRRRAAAAAADAAPVVPIAELAQRASSALVATDDALRTSEQELGFATAQFGDAATVEFSAALASAREKLAQAFALKQQLEDATPDTEEQVRAWNTDIIRLCDEAEDAVDEKAAEFDALRALEAEAPAALERVRRSREAAAAEVDHAAASLQALRGTYAADTLATVDDNVEQARARLAFADTRLGDAADAIAAGTTGEAAVALRDAEEAVAQAAQLEQAVDALGTDLAAAEPRAQETIAELERDIRVAESLPDPDGRIASVVAATRAHIEAARAELAGSERRPLRTLQALQEADREIDEVVQTVRDATARAERIGRQLDADIARAQAQVSAAENFVASRRGAVGADARTRLAEASASLSRAQAMRSADPDAALRDARRADDLAGQAIGLARSDVGGFSAPRSGGGDSFVGGMLGGFLGDALLGGGGSARGSSWGSSGSGRSSWSSGSSRRSSGFGGGSRSRSGSGGFGGGSRGRSGGSRSSRGGGRF